MTRELPPPRRLGPSNYDTHCPWDVVGRVEAPAGLGIVDEFRFARAHAGDRPLRVAVPGPLTLLMPLRRGGPYTSEDSLVADLVSLVNREVRALVEAGCDFVQIDEPNAVMAAGKHRILKAGPGALVEALRGVVDPHILDAPVDQFVFEYASREMAEIDLWSLHPTRKEVAVGVIDVKAFRVESAEEVAARVRLALKHVPADRLWLVPDCGLGETPRWVAVSKLRSMVEAARLVRRELSGRS